MIFEEFKHLKQIEDKKNPFCNLYEIDKDTHFYVEPVFHTQMLGFKERISAGDYQRIIDRIIEVAKKNKKVIFTGNFEFPQTEQEGYIILEITDITNPLQIFVEDKSRGSDYGD